MNNDPFQAGPAISDFDSQSPQLVSKKSGNSKVLLYILLAIIALCGFCCFCAFAIIGLQELGILPTSVPTAIP